MTTVESLLEEVQQLSEAEQGRLLSELASRIWGAPPNSRSDDEWLAEIQRRGSEPRVDWEIAQTRMFGRKQA